MLTRTMDSKGVTLVENLVGILLLGILVTSVLGAYYLSLSTVSRGKHIAVANSILQSYMEQERQAGYSGGKEVLLVRDSYYVTMPLSTGGSIPIKIDDRGTADTSDDLIGVLSCSPWCPANYEAAPGAYLNFDGVQYKTVGFVVSWVEKTPLMGQSRVYSVRTASYICEH